MERKLSKPIRELVPFTRIRYNQLFSQGETVIRTQRRIRKRDKCVLEYYRCLGRCFMHDKSMMKCGYSGKLTYFIGTIPERLELIHPHDDHPTMTPEIINKKKRNISKKETEMNLCLALKKDPNPKEDNENISNSLLRFEDRSHSDNISHWDEISSHEINIHTTCVSSQDQTEKEDKDKVIDINESIKPMNYIAKCFESSFTLVNSKEKKRKGSTVLY